MAATGESDQRTLADLRAKIDRIDEAMHHLLMDRATVIDALIRTKGTNQSAPFRPQREAEMMRRLAARHEGSLPLATVEHLWREIITTFTFLQSPFRLVVDGSQDRVAMHDLARFAFGFAVPLVEAGGADEVVAKVASSGTDLGLILQSMGSAQPWWRRLSAEKGPRIMALLPFLTLKRQTAMPAAFVISPALAEPTPPDLRVLAARAALDGVDAAGGLSGAAILDQAAAGDRRELLLAVAEGVAEPDLRAAGLTDIVPVGGVARGIAIGSPGGVLRAAIDGSMAS